MITTIRSLLPQFVSRSTVRSFGGYIETAQLSLFGLDVYRDLYGSTSLPSRAFIIPNHESWPSNLWGLKLGEAVREHVLNEDEKQRQAETLCFSESSLTSIKQILTLCNPLEISDDQKVKKMVSSAEKKVAVRRAAVLVALCSNKGEASVLFTVRSDKVGTHRGQVSFPGGHIMDGETPTDAALRETYEEIGTNIGPIRVLGICQTVPAITGTLVTPIVGYLERDIGDMKHLSLNAAEVKSAFTRPISKLLDPSYRTYEFGNDSFFGILYFGKTHLLILTTYDNTFVAVRPNTKVTNGKDPDGLIMPVYGKGLDEGDEKIWGLTAWIADAVLTKSVHPYIH